MAYAWAAPERLAKLSVAQFLAYLDAVVEREAGEAVAVEQLRSAFGG